MKALKEIFSPFPANVPLMDKSGSWFLKPKCAKTPVEQGHFK